MARLLLSDLACETAAIHRRVADAVEAETRRVERLRNEKGSAEVIPKRAARNSGDALRYTLSHATNTQALWHSALELLKDGLSGEELAELLPEVRDAADAWPTLAQKTRALWESAAANATMAGLAELTRAEARVRGAKAAAEQVAAFMARPRRPLDPARLQRGRDEAQQGKVRSPEQMRAGLVGRNL